MRIDLTQAAASQSANEPNAKQVGANNGATSVLAGGEDRTTLTSDTQSLGSLVSTAMNSPEIRQEKVDSLTQAVSSGTYKLDPGKIAASMIDEHA
ncbi:MAG TPA: flagellar biosynthesis anti-sigma factor FlgM [Terracidiphilus sp.]|jgi:flagellar biosynthesis anti-sigma factor FlgM|nr:flagellar biosynthesis anti-sigma factor FlgM [Terracidiphilus sp.]